MIYAVTNRKLAISMEKYYNNIGKCFKKNIEGIIIREKDLDYEELYCLSKKIKSLKKESHTKIIINSNLNIARNLNLDGIQLSYNEFIKKFKVKLNLNFSGILGISVHSVEEALDAFNRGADYIVLGHIYETKCKEGLKPRGVEILRELRKKTDGKVIAIGGISIENIREVLNSGATSVAMMSEIMESENLISYLDEISKIL